ncbi:MAG: DUF4397 domain-containing protein [Bacteroidetes bacterium]|nr:DUF4397 domain-containing protein [Bacteroidota bacterium]
MKTLFIRVAGYFMLSVGAMFLITACSKSNNSGNNNNNSGQAYVSATNASPSSTAYSVYADSANLTTSGMLGFGMTTGNGGSPYQTIVSGNDSIKWVASGSTSAALDTSYNFSSGQYYSLFLYDTAMPGSSLKTVILKDNLTAPASGQAEIRFVSFSPNALMSEGWLINGTDTLQLKNMVYAGGTVYNVDTLSAFTTVTPGTYSVVLNNAENLNLLANDSITLAAGKIYTLYSKGYTGITGSNAFNVGLITHN